MKKSFGVLLSGIAVFALMNISIAQPALKDVFRDYFLVGAALNAFQFTGRDTSEVPLIVQQFNSISPENVLKWGNIHPRPQTYNFGPGDQYVDFGEQHSMFVIGHTLIWHSQTPRWVFEDSNGNPASRELLLERMKDHIYTVVGRYKGRIKGWDVVNEALEEDGSYRKSPWEKIIGEDFIVKAFQFAHEADPNAELYYNDYSIENEPKRNGVIRLVKKLQASGVHISGVGIQGHYKMDWPSPEQIDSTIKAFGTLGVKAMITELDVDILPQTDFSTSAEISRSAEYAEKMNPYKNGLPEEKQRELAQRYADLFKVFERNKEILMRVTFWGVTDRDSWLNNWPVRGRTSYPLLFDRSGKQKPAFSAVEETLQ